MPDPSYWSFGLARAEVNPTVCSFKEGAEISLALESHVPPLQWALVGNTDVTLEVPSSPLWCVHRTCSCCPQRLSLGTQHPEPGAWGTRRQLSYKRSDSGCLTWSALDTCKNPAPSSLCTNLEMQRSSPGWLTL